MRGSKLRRLIFMALCCDLGLFTKRLIAPAANLITDFLHIPGGIGTAFSLMFLVIAVALMPKFGAGAIMGAVQSGIALAFGMVGSMGALSPIGYIASGLAIDFVFLALRRTKLDLSHKMLAANALASVAASMAANWIVFRLQGFALLLYLSVSCTSGAIFGLVGAGAAKRLIPVVGKGEGHEEK